MWYKSTGSSDKTDVPNNRVQPTCATRLWRGSVWLHSLFVYPAWLRWASRKRLTQNVGRQVREHLSQSVYLGHLGTIPRMVVLW